MKTSTRFEKLIQKMEEISKNMDVGASIPDILQLEKHLKLLMRYMVEENKSWSSSEDYYTGIPRVILQLKVIVSLFIKIIPTYHEIIRLEYDAINHGDSNPKDNGIFSLLEHCVDLLDVAFIGEGNVEKGKIYLGIKEKIRQAGQSFRNGDYPGLFSSLHTSVELVLKDKLGIPLSIGEIKIGRIIGICIKRNVFPNKETLLKDLDQKICEIDNKLKHAGYNPSNHEASAALLVAEQSLRVLEKENPEISEETKREISSLLL